MNELNVLCVYIQLRGNQELIQLWVHYVLYLQRIKLYSLHDYFMEWVSGEPSLNEARQLGFYAWPSSKSRPGKAGLLHTERKYTQRGSFVVTQFKRARLRVDTLLLLFYRGKGVLTTFLILTFRDCWLRTVSWCDFFM